MPQVTVTLDTHDVTEIIEAMKWSLKAHEDSIRPMGMRPSDSPVYQQRERILNTLKNALK